MASPTPTPLIRPGRNCWRRERAERFGVLVDAEDYFRALADTLPLARHSIRILGWEFDSRTRLLRGDGGGGLAIGPLLDALVRRHPGLRVDVSNDKGLRAT